MYIKLCIIIIIIYYTQYKYFKNIITQQFKI